MHPFATTHATGSEASSNPTYKLQSEFGHVLCTGWRRGPPVYRPTELIANRHTGKRLWNDCSAFEQKRVRLKGPNKKVPGSGTGARELLAVRYLHGEEGRGIVDPDGAPVSVYSIDKNIPGVHQHHIPLRDVVGLVKSHDAWEGDRGGEARPGQAEARILNEVV